MHIPDIHSKNKCSVQGKSPSNAHSSERIVTRLGPVTHICDNNNSKDHDGWLATVKCITGGSVNALLSGVPDYFGRNKISSGGDLSHYSSASLY